MRSTNSVTSSSLKALPSDSIGTACCTFGKAARRRGTDLLRRRVRRDEIGKFRLDGLQPLAQRIIGRIRHRRRILLVIALVMRFDLQREPHVLDLGLRLGEFDVGKRAFFAFAMRSIRVEHDDSAATAWRRGKGYARGIVGPGRQAQRIATIHLRCARRLDDGGSYGSGGAGSRLCGGSAMRGARAAERR